MVLLEEYFKGKEFNWDIGLERIKGAVKEFKGKDYPSIVVAGTNGKGTTSHLIAEALKRQGLKVGLFTSPHVYSFTERIKVDLKEVSVQELNRSFREILPLVERFNLTYFEASLILALSVFREEGVDCAVFEVGLGGRLDAVNALNHQLAVLTGVSLDHTDYLGSTLREIAREKVAVFKGKEVGVVSEVSREVLKVLKSEFKGELHLYGRDFWADGEELFKFGTSFYYMGQLPIKLSLVGKHYCRNASTAIRAAQVFCERFLGRKFKIPKDFSVVLPGRFEVLRREPFALFDGAHNTEALRALFSTLKELNLKASVVFGSFKDKELSLNLKAVKDYLDWSCGELLLVEIPSERGAGVELLLETAEKLKIGKVKSLKRISLRELSFPVVITGSFYLGGLIERG